MATITLKGNPVHTAGDLPGIGKAAPDFSLTGTDLGEVTLKQFRGKKVILNIFPSLDTSTCAMSVRKFNAQASTYPNTVVICISKDLPFAHKRFCSTEGLDKVISASQFKDEAFGKTYGVLMTDGGMAGFFSRAVVIVDEKGIVKYTEQVPEIAQEPDYEAALKAL
jgi:thioredoxin-dependent peroxiredoxin